MYKRQAVLKKINLCPLVSSPFTFTFISGTSNKPIIFLRIILLITFAKLYLVQVLSISILLSIVKVIGVTTGGGDEGDPSHPRAIENFCPELLHLYLSLVPVPSQLFFLG